MSHPTRLPIAKPLQFWLICLFLVAVALTGGSARSDAQPSAFLQPLSIFVCGVALCTLDASHFRKYWVILVSCAAVFLMILVQLIPVPSTTWAAMQGRSEISALDIQIGLGAIWRPISVAPWMTCTSLYSLLPPVAVILIGSQLSQEDLYRLLPLLIVLGAVSGALGLFQLVSGTESPFYFYDVTNEGSAVGLFANRNHAALLLACLFPILSVFALYSAQVRSRINRPILCIAMALVLVPLILVTGSRSGLLIAILGLAGAALLYLTNAKSMPMRGKQATALALPVMIGFVVVCLVLVTLAFSRAEAIDRLFLQNATTDKRNLFWVASLKSLLVYLPWGSGAGSFAVVYGSREPTNMLDWTYLNNAHNDILESVITLGMGVSILLILGIFYVAWRMLILWCRGDGRRKSVLVARMSSLLIIMMIGASLSDYPLRTPFLMSVFALVLLWFVQPVHQSKWADKNVK